MAWARADSRVLNINGHNDIIGHAGIFLRDATFDARPVKVGGVATCLDCRRQSIASDMIRVAVTAMRDTYGVDFGLLFCEQRHAPP